MNRFYAYIRVSTVKQGEKGVSLIEQRSAIESYAVRHEHKIVEWFEEKETAAKRGRPVFSRMLGLLRAGRARGVIIHKIDRSTRNHHDWADLRELADAGVEIYSAHDNLDLKSRGGRLSADIQAVFAVDYISNLRDEVRKGIQGRLKQGLYPLPAPLGYQNNGGGKAKTPDPITAPLIRKAFELYATGQYSLKTLGAELRRLGLRNLRGGRVTKTGVSTILNQEFYIGIIKIRRTGEHYQGVHEPLIAKSLFDRVQRLLKQKTQSRGWKHDFLYRKALRCTHCGHVLVGERQKGHIYYRCHIFTCPRLSLREETISTQIEQLLARIRLDPEHYQLLDAHLRKRADNREVNGEKEVQAITLRLAQCQDRLDRLFDAYIDDRTIDKEMYERRKEKLLHERGQLNERIEEIRSGDGARAEERREKLELVKALSLQRFPGNTEEELDLLRRASSNLGADGKYIVVEWELPFNVLAAREEYQFGAPQRASSRTTETCASGNNAQNTKESVARKPRKKWMEKWFEAIWKSLNDEEGCERPNV